MALVTMKQLVDDAWEKGTCIPAFNVGSLEMVRGALRAAEELDVPVIIQIAERLLKYSPLELIGPGMVQAARESRLPVAVNFDHSSTFEVIEKALQLGFTSVMYDGSTLPFEENIRMTKEASDYAHAHGVFSEGELGVITGVEEDVVADVEKLADYDDTVKFAAATGIDFMAPAIGTAHGVYKKTPHLNFELVERLGKDLPQPIVCHGGTGLSDDTFRKLISLGIAKVNISTALKHAYIDGAEKYARETPDDYEPLHLEQAMFDSVKAVAKHHIEVFANGR